MGQRQSVPVPRTLAALADTKIFKFVFLKENLRAKGRCTVSTGGETSPLSRLIHVYTLHTSSRPHPTTPTRRAYFRAHAGDSRRGLPPPRRGRRARRHRWSSRRRRRLQCVGGPMPPPCLPRQGRGRPYINDISRRSRRQAAKAAVQAGRGGDRPRLPLHVRQVFEDVEGAHRGGVARAKLVLVRLVE